MGPCACVELRQLRKLRGLTQADSDLQEDMAAKQRRWQTPTDGYTLCQLHRPRIVPSCVVASRPVPHQLPLSSMIPAHLKQHHLMVHCQFV